MLVLVRMLGNPGGGEVAEAMVYPTIKWILVVVALLAVLASADLQMYPGSKEVAEIFECSRTILLFLAFLVLGFQFGQISR
jgi:hypothetical protein